MKRLLRFLMQALLKVLRYGLGKSFVKMNFRILSQLASANSVLRELGATVGPGCHIPCDICIYNMDAFSCHNLIVGSNVYIGPRCLFDLTEKIVIEDHAAISAQVSFITHLDVGNQPLKEKFPRRQGPIVIGKGGWIGVNSTILYGVTVGEYAAIGAMSLVNRDIPGGAVAYGIPCRVKSRDTGVRDSS